MLRKMLTSRAQRQPWLTMGAMQRSLGGRREDADCAQFFIRPTAHSSLIYDHQRLLTIRNDARWQLCTWRTQRMRRIFITVATVAKGTREFCASISYGLCTGTYSPSFTRTHTHTHTPTHTHT